MNKFNETLPIVFMHVPKTGGTSLITALSDAIHPKISFGGFDRSLFAVLDNFSEFGAQQRAIVHLNDDKIPRDADFVAAHMAKSTLFRNYPSSNFMTLIREPVSRLLSLWLYWRTMSDRQLAPWGQDWADRVKLSRLSLRDFLIAPRVACQTDNQFTRMLLWPHALIPDNAFMTGGDDTVLLADAIASLDDFQFVGAVESESLSENLGAWLGKPITIGHHNKTEALPAYLQAALENEINDETLHLLAFLSRLDAVVWQRIYDKEIVMSDTVRDREQIIADTISKHSRILSASN